MGLTRRFKTERFVLTGNISSKKNSRINTVRNGRVLSFPNKSYTQKLKGFISEIESQWSHDSIVTPCSIKLKFYTPHDSWSKELQKSNSITNFKGSDIDNKITSVFDILVTGKFLKDDSLITSVIAVKYPGKKMRSGEFGCEVSITYQG